jgi:hypothetical protein
MAVYPTVAETARKLKAAHFSLTTGDGSTPDRAAFMALLLLEADPDTCTGRLDLPQRPVTVRRLSILPPVDLPAAW